MTPEQLKDEVDRIISISGDAEYAHLDEDKLHLEVIRQFCPTWVVEEVDRLTSAKFPRWYA